MWEKLKYLLRDDRLFQFLVICLLLISAFLLGRLSVQVAAVFESPNTAVRLLASPPQPDTYTIPATATTTTSVYASVNGERYYSMDCGAGERIAEENKIYFASADPAEAAGYTQSAQCVFPETI